MMYDVIVKSPSDQLHREGAKIKFKTAHLFETTVYPHGSYNCLLLIIFFHAAWELVHGFG